MPYAYEIQDVSQTDMYTLFHDINNPNTVSMWQVDYDGFVKSIIDYCLGRIKSSINDDMFSALDNSTKQTICLTLNRDTIKAFVPMIVDMCKTKKYCDFYVDVQPKICINADVAHVEADLRFIFRYHDKTYYDALVFSYSDFYQLPLPLGFILINMSIYEGLIKGLDFLAAQSVKKMTTNSLVEIRVDVNKTWSKLTEYVRMFISKEC